MITMGVKIMFSGFKSSILYKPPKMRHAAAWPRPSRFNLDSNAYCRYRL
jgi:hypothetical protein